MPSENRAVPSLKSASGAGFTFEDKTAALLLCEMLTAQRSLGEEYGIVQQLERQAVDWEPFGDLLLYVPNSAGTLVRCGGSVKSNQQINTNGCDEEMRNGLWSLSTGTGPATNVDALALFCAPLSATVRNHVSTLCYQAREMDPTRLDEKTVHAGIRKIYESFRHPNLGEALGLPGVVLSRFLLREFDFEALASRDTADALRLCREALSVETQNEATGSALWNELQRIAQGLRVSAGSITRERLSAKLRPTFQLRDDPCDTASWARIRTFSQQGLEEIATTLPGGITLPRTLEQNKLTSTLAESRSCFVLGDSGSGKSALVKTYASKMAASGTEVVWVRGDRFSNLLSVVPHFVEVAMKTRRNSALLIIDAVESCYNPNDFAKVARTVAALTTEQDSPWCVILICQTAEWARITSGLVKEIASHPLLAKQVECGGLAKEDFDLLCAAFPSVAHLAHRPELRRLLSSPKILDVLLTGQLAESRALAGEADLVEWWWEKQVRVAKPVAPEERVARQIAIYMADQLCSEVQPDFVTGSEEAASALIRNRVLRRTSEGLLRFDHDLLADWSRVMHLKALGKRALLTFIRGHIQNPPWLRAIRLLSQHLLDRLADLDWWREILSACSVVDKPTREPSTDNLQVVDAWLEGIIFSVEPAHTLGRVRSELFANEGWLMRRLVRRLMYVGTLPDPVMEERFRLEDVATLEAVSTRYRLPLWGLWSPIISFVIAHSKEAINSVPTELGEIAAMWARTEEYLGLNWTSLADLVVANAEEELRREISGKFHRADDSRVTIYAGALYAASQDANRVAKLILKAAGRAPWGSGDLEANVDPGWRGEWEEPHSIIYEESGVEIPLTSWPDGPTRRTSSDFFHAWFDSGAALRFYRRAPEASCEASLGFLLDWPKRRPRQRELSGSMMDHYGFQFEADHLYPAFYTKGPFLIFLRENWRPAIDLIARLVNFATRRYADWWPYDSQPIETKFSTEQGEALWLGNHQVYAWNRFHMNTVEVVTCALMALEKWLEEKIQEGEPIADPVNALYQQGKSLAFAGVLIAVGKRHPDLFNKELKPLLFLREIYMHDLRSVTEGVGSGYSLHEGELINNLRREWESLPGRKTSLFDACCQWLLARPELRPVLTEVSTKWRKDAEKLPTGSKDAIELLRWASRLDLSCWSEVTRPDGRKAWGHRLPEELQDIETEKALTRQQALLTLPYQCSEMLERRQLLQTGQLEAIWQQLLDWQSLMHSRQPAGEKDEFTSSFLDDRHSHAGLIAVILCLGADWLDSNPGRRSWLEKEVLKLLADQPKVTIYTAEDSHEDCETFLARSVIQCWAHSPRHRHWRRAAGNFISMFRYKTIERLFDEAFQVRELLGNGFRDLGALALSYAIVRHEAKLDSVQPKLELINKWRRKWPPRFARRRGPKWTDHWNKLEVAEAYPPFDRHYERTGRTERARRDYGFDIGVLLAAFGGLPKLSAARNVAERTHWLHICRELLHAYIRTLPPDNVSDAKDEWRFQMWSVDKQILNLVAARIFQCSSDEQRMLWVPIFNLPPAAHDHITNFLSTLLIEVVGVEPPRIAELVPLWRAMAEHLFASSRWTEGLRREQNKVWQYIFLYGTPFSSVGDKDHAPLVHGLQDLFERHIKNLGADPYDQSSLAAFLATEAGQQILVEALEWLGPSWQTAQTYFWKRVVERGHFERLLRCAWRNYFEAIRLRAASLAAFKVLTLGLATQQVPIALEIQQQVGTQ